MTDQTQDSDDFFFGVMLLKEGKWTPHSKYNKDSFGNALIKAESLDEDRVAEGVRLMKIHTMKGEEPQEVWLSPHLKARAEARAASQVRDGVKKTKQSMAEEHEKLKAKHRGS